METWGVLTDTITVTELVWTLVSLLTGIGQVWILSFFVGQFVLAKKDRVLGLTFLGAMNIIRHSLKLSIQIAACGVGVYQMTIPPTNPLMPITLAGIVVTMTIVYMEVALLGTSILELYTIHHVRVLPKRQSDLYLASGK